MDEFDTPPRDARTMTAPTPPTSEELIAWGKNRQDVPLWVGLLAQRLEEAREAIKDWREPEDYTAYVAACERLLRELSK